MPQTQKTILVADDESHILNVVSLKLRNAGYRVVTASDGQEALTRFQELNSKDPLNADVQSWLGFLYIQTGTPDKAVAPLEKAAEGQCNEVGKDKRDDGRGAALRASEGLDHRHPILPVNRQWNKRQDNACPFWPISEVYKKAAPRPAVQMLYSFFGAK